MTIENSHKKTPANWPGFFYDLDIRLCADVSDNSDFFSLGTFLTLGYFELNPLSLF